jgi:hypothetical protein
MQMTKLRRGTKVRVMGNAHEHTASAIRSVCRDHHDVDGMVEIKRTVGGITIRGQAPPGQLTTLHEEIVAAAGRS